MFETLFGIQAFRQMSIWLPYSWLNLFKAHGVVWLWWVLKGLEGSQSQKRGVTQIVVHWSGENELANHRCFVAGHLASTTPVTLSLNSFNRTITTSSTTMNPHRAVAMQSSWPVARYEFTREKSAKQILHTKIGWSCLHVLSIFSFGF